MPKTRMTDAEVMRNMNEDTELNKVRRIFSAWCARIEQIASQSKLTPVEIRRMEFEAAQAIKDMIDASTP